MEPDVEKTTAEDGSQLNRNRSFKSKQLVRSQAIRESQSPPRSSSPVADAESVATLVDDGERTVTVPDHGNHESSHISDICSDRNNDCHDDKKKQQVEIQITPGAWDVEVESDQRVRTKRWLGHRNHSDCSRDLLSNNPRVACVCGACAACPQCRGRRRRHFCTTKQDSGILCPDDCPDGSDSEQTGGAKENMRKSGSLDVDEHTFYCRCPERKEKAKSMSFTKSDSDDKTEPTGPELVAFIQETLNKNGRDRMTLLRIEKELHSLVNDTGRCIVRFPVMTSYGRMLVHRCASLFQLSHHLDQTCKTAVVVSKSGTSGGRIPCTSFKQWCTATFPPSPQRHQIDVMNAKSILKRDTHSLDESGSGSLSSNRSKSLEQREREYERVRRRIFSTDNCNQDESQWPWLTGGPVKLLTPETGRNKLIKVQSLESGSGGSPNGGNLTTRGAVSKSHSFGGYAAAEPTHPRLLSRQGDLASSSWRLSPSSSGYKTLSLRSTDSVTPSPTGGASPEPGVTGSEGVAVVWAVTDLSAVPPGAVVIHPQTGRPLTNPDGSVYHFDPSHPPILYDANVYIQHDNKVEQNCEKRRGKLEKQHSFMDHECDCQPVEECRGKCCCECRRNEGCQQRKPTEKENHTKPTCPSPNHCEPKNQTHNQESTEQKPPIESLTNQKTEQNERPYDTRAHGQTTNQRAFDAQRNFEASNQRPANEGNNRTVNKLANQESHEVQYAQTYQQGFRSDEVTSPPQTVMNHFFQPDLNMMAHTKVTPVPMADPNIRPMSLTNVMYPTPVAQGYQYVNQCRVDQQLQTIYQPVMQQPTEEQKQLSAAPQDNTFRIDPSYPFAAIDYAGACVDTTMQPHRSYSVPYAQVDMTQTVMPQAYPVGNVVLPQTTMQHYPYQDAMQWTGVQPGVTAPKLFIPDLYPMVQYPTPYPQYNVVYPQMVPQPYPICQPVYPIVEKQPEAPQRPNSNTNIRQSKRNSISSSSRNTPLQTPPEDRKAPYVPKEKAYRQDSNEIAVKIQQIKDQMAQLNTKEREKNRRGPDEWKKRNGNGILGSYPSSNFNGRFAGRPNEDNPMSHAARAIVNSIRNIQVKNTYHQDRRYENTYQRFENAHQRFENPHQRFDGRQDRVDARNRHRQERDDRPAYGERSQEGQTSNPKPPENVHGGQERRFDVRNRNVNPMQLHYRPPYLLRQMSAGAGAWCRRSPGPVHPALNHPRRPNPDTRNGRR